MKLTLESTAKLVELDGVLARVWEGHTERGAPVHAFIVRVAVDRDLPESVHADFERDLKECRVPSPEVEAIPLRLVL